MPAIMTTSSCGRILRGRQLPTRAAHKGVPKGAASPINLKGKLMSHLTQAEPCPSSDIGL